MRAGSAGARSDLGTQDPAAVDDQLVDLPGPCANALVRGGYRTRAEVAAASDEALGRLRGIGQRRLAVIRATIPAGAPTPVGAPLPRAAAAAERLARRSRRHERERAIRGAILDCLRAGGALGPSAIRRHLVDALGSCAEMTFRSRLRALVLSGEVEAVAVRSADGAATARRVLFALPSGPHLGDQVRIRLCGCARPDSRHEGRGGTVVARLQRGAERRFVVRIAPGVLCDAVDAAVGVGPEL